MNEQLIRRFKEKLASGKAVVGPFMKTADPAFVEAAGYAHMDFAILDMEHGPVSVQAMQNNIRAAQLSEMLPIIRVPDATEEAIGKALDIGAAAVEIPQICTAEQARHAVELAKFYPRGNRGVCRFVRAAHYSAQSSEEYFEKANQTMVILQLEGQEAIKNLDEILEVQGVDIVFIGPYDLSQSMGLTGQTTHPKVIAQMKEIAERAKQMGVLVGTFTDSEETMKLWCEAGVQYISYSVDVGLFYDMCKMVVKQFEQIVARIGNESA